MIAGIHISQEIFAMDVLTASESSLESNAYKLKACSAIVTTTWRQGFTLAQFKIAPGSFSFKPIFLLL